MKESFIFHADFIADLPEEYISQFTMYAVNYGLNGAIPTLSGLELALWNKIQRRIDADQEAWEESKIKRSEAGKLGGMRSGASRAKLSNAPKIEANEAMLQETKQEEAMLSNASNAEANEAVNVFVNDNVSNTVYQSVDVNVSPKSEPKNNNTFYKNKKLDLTRNQIAKIEAHLQTEGLDKSYLEYCYTYLQNFYDKQEVDTALFYKAVLTYDNLRSDYSKLLMNSPAKIPKFDTCPNCGKQLAWVDDNQRFCKGCGKDFYYLNKKWQEWSA